MHRMTIPWTTTSKKTRGDRGGTATAEGNITLKCDLPREPALRVTGELTLAHAEHEATLSVGSRAGTIGVSGDASDPHLLHARAWVSDPDFPRGTVAYRLVPDVTRWAHDEAGREQYRREFAHVKGWAERRIRLSIDVTPCEVRAWIDGRLVASWSARNPQPGVAMMHLPEGARPHGPADVTILPDEEGFLPLDLRPLTRGEDFLDLKETAYRGRAPRVFASSLSSDPKRALFRIPRKTYDRVHLVCSARTEGGALPSASVAFIKPERGHTVFTEFSVKRPYQTPQAITVPLDPCAFSDFLNDPGEEALEVEFCQRMDYDEGRFPHPAGPPSGVRIHEITFETAPVALRVTSSAVGHVFQGTKTPRFFVHLESQRSVPGTVRVAVEVAEPYGKKLKSTVRVRLAPWETRTKTFDLPQRMYGRFGLTVTVSQEDGSRPLKRSTTFALLPRDTRKATSDSPFGIWCFFENHHGVPPETAAPLFRKAGARWTLANFVVRDDPHETRKRVQTLAAHGIGLACANVACIGNTCNAGGNDVDAMIRRMHAMPPVKHWLLFWETFLSRQHMRDYPFDILGKPVRELTPDEESVFKNCWDTAIEYAKRVRQEFPVVKLIFGNGHPNFIAAFLRRGFPKEYIDGFGLDFDMFVSSPELQPGPLHCPFNGLFFLKTLQDLYGYSEIPRYLTEAVYCSQSEGWLTERQQADHYVRSHLLGLASGVVLFGMTAELNDPGSEYFYGSYGPVGFLRRAPELNPRESFCAYATMTKMLDRANFTEMVPMPSPGTYGLRFTKAGGSDIYAFWTTTGTRPLTFGAEGGSVRTTDLFGNQTVIRNARGVFSLNVSPSPVYVEGDGIHGFVLGTPRHRPGPKTSVPIVRMADLPSWRHEAEDDAWMERLGRAGNWAITAPTIRGRFEFLLKKDRARGQILRVSLSRTPGAHPLHLHYAVLRFPAKVPLNGAFSALGVWIRGNSSSGRVLYELEDADGVIWRSVYSDTYIDFDGWRYVQTPLPLPAAEDGSRLQPCGLTPWATETEHRQPALPVRLTALIIESRTHVVRATSLDPVPDTTFDISDVVVTKEMVDPEIRFRW